MSTLETLTCYSVSVVLENGFSNLASPRTTFVKVISNLVFVTLAFMCLILGCLYKSIITTDIILPITGTIPYRNYSQLQNFTLVALPAKDLQVFPREIPKGWIKDRVGLSLFKAGMIPCLELGVYIKHIIDSLDTAEGLAAKDKFMQVEYYTDILDRIRIFEFEEDALTQVGKCTEKIAYVGSADEIEDFLKVPSQKVKLRKGQDKFLPHRKYWNIPFSVGGFVHRGMAQLISSGIYHIWEKVFYAKTRDELDISLKKTIDAKQTLDTNLGVLFKVVGLGLAISTLVFCIEILILLMLKTKEQFIRATRKPWRTLDRKKLLEFKSIFMIMIRNE